MIDLFTIFGKGGIVLWCFQEGGQYFRETINDLIQNVILQERGSFNNYSSNNVTLKYKLDNEFEIVFLIVYQSFIQLTYADKLLSEIQIRFRDMYKNVLENRNLVNSQNTELFNNFDKEFKKIINRVREEAIKQEEIHQKPRTFQESEKSKKTIESIMLNKENKTKNKDVKKGKENVSNDKVVGKSVSPISSTPASPSSDVDEEVLKNRASMMAKMKGKAKMPSSPPTSINEKKKGKKARVWGYGNDVDVPEVLDYSADGGKKMELKDGEFENEEVKKFVENHRSMVGNYKGDLPGLDEESDEDEDDNDEDTINDLNKKSGWFSSLSKLISNKQLTNDDIEPILKEMKETLISKNVASEPAEKICQSVGGKLTGKVIGTFSRVKTIVKEAMKESLVQLLTPKRRVDILRDIIEAKREGRPYVIVFCGVNGVGKSTNLSKVTFWLNENGHRVLIAAGDTFRAGAVEQLRTHMRNLNSLHPDSVQLYEQGYGKDPAGLAAGAIMAASERGIDVVLVDTAGRMQDNEPLMRSLSKLIRMNEPDLVLFVGEALVGNEAVDQLVKFNQALADNSVPGQVPRLIDGIVLTKFDTIDDKVGAAISMTYITGQPIVFVGCGQTYTDLKNLNVNAVVNSLLR
uniref:Col_cuticle_N domain-containing protein n=1 Tax=Strongyloides stercoralis TaxID=6248 RepID=A0AAF5D3D4_STRER